MSETSRQARISLQEVSSQTVRQILALTVKPEQERYVASNAVTIAQAYFDRDSVWLRAVYADQTPVGFLAVWDAGSECHLLRFMIDHTQQGRGYGRLAMHCLLDHVAQRPAVQRITLYCLPGAGSPQAFYESLGFVATGEMDEDALVMALPLGALRVNPNGCLTHA